MGHGNQLDHLHYVGLNKVVVGSLTVTKISLRLFDSAVLTLVAPPAERSARFAVVVPRGRRSVLPTRSSCPSRRLSTAEER